MVFGFSLAICARELIKRPTSDKIMINDTALAGWISDRTSRRTSLLASQVLAFLSTLFFCLGRNPWVLVSARACQGLSAGVVYTVGLALVADSVNPEEIGSW